MVKMNPSATQNRGGGGMGVELTVRATGKADVNFSIEVRVSPTVYFLHLNSSPV